MRATLISWTLRPIETVAILWEASKGEKSLGDITSEVYGSTGGKTRNIDLFRQILGQEIPVTENIAFTFMCEDVPVSWREQAVRHRVGVRYGDNFAVDIVADADLTFWSQSMRIQNMSHFAEEGCFHIPESVEGHLDTYTSAMMAAQDAYRRLTEAGVPLEDARNVIPLGATHRISMTVNLRALQHIIGERTCWILQASLWHPIIRDMLKELQEKVSPVFSVLAHPPCVKQEQFKACVFDLENARRWTGADPLPICPLWAKSNGHEVTEEQRKVVQDKVPEFARMWMQPHMLDGYWVWK